MGDEITEEEVPYLLSEFKRLFPKELYTISPKRKIEEEIHVCVGLTHKEKLRRTNGNAGQIVIVPKTEVVERLNHWNDV